MLKIEPGNEIHEKHKLYNVPLIERLRQLHQTKRKRKKGGKEYILKCKTAKYGHRSLILIKSEIENISIPVRGVPSLAESTVHTKHGY